MRNLSEVLDNVLGVMPLTDETIGVIIELKDIRDMMTFVDIAKKHPFLKSKNTTRKFWGHP